MAKLEDYQDGDMLKTINDIQDEMIEHLIDGDSPEDTAMCLYVDAHCRRCGDFHRHEMNFANSGFPISITPIVDGVSRAIGQKMLSDGQTPVGVFLALRSIQLISEEYDGTEFDLDTKEGRYGLMEIAARNLGTGDPLPNGTHDAVVIYGVSMESRHVGMHATIDWSGDEPCLAGVKIVGPFHPDDDNAHELSGEVSTFIDKNVAKFVTGVLKGAHEDGQMSEGGFSIGSIGPGDLMDFLKGQMKDQMTKRLSNDESTPADRLFGDAMRRFDDKPDTSFWKN